MSDTNNAAQAPAAGTEAPEVTGEALEAVTKERDELKSFFEGLQPLLTKLDASPESVQAILDDKFTNDLAKAALEGKLTVAEAQAAAQAVAEVTEEQGAAAVEAMTPEKLATLVDEKMTAFKKEFEQKEEDRQFEEYTNKFISETPDFKDFQPQIAEWLEKHDVTDVRVAYYAVKGELSEKDATAKADADAAETAKNVMLNASGGGVTAQHAPDGSPLIDALIAGRSSGNSF